MAQHLISESLYLAWAQGDDAAIRTSCHILQTCHFASAQFFFQRKNILGDPEEAFQGAFIELDEQVRSKRDLWRSSKEFHGLFKVMLVRKCIREKNRWNFQRLIADDPTLENSPDVNASASQVLVSKDWLVHFVHGLSSVSEQLHYKGRSQRALIADALILVVKKELLSANPEIVSDLNKIVKALFEFHQMPDFYPRPIRRFFDSGKLLDIVKRLSGQPSNAAHNLKESIDLIWDEAIDYQALVDTTLEDILATVENSADMAVMLSEKEVWHSVSRILDLSSQDLYKPKERFLRDLVDLHENGTLPAALRHLITSINIFRKPMKKVGLKSCIQ